MFKKNDVSVLKHITLSFFHQSMLLFVYAEYQSMTKTQEEHKKTFLLYSLYTWLQSAPNALFSPSQLTFNSVTSDGY